jgi:hypothetical protein
MSSYPNLLVCQDSFEGLVRVVLDFGFWILDFGFWRIVLSLISKLTVLLWVSSPVLEDVSLELHIFRVGVIMMPVKRYQKCLS